MFLVSYIDEEKQELECTLRKLRLEKEETEKSFKLSQKKLDEAAQVAAEARDKVKDALTMAQDALANEANLLGKYHNIFLQFFFLSFPINLIHKSFICLRRYFIIYSS